MERRMGALTAHESCLHSVKIWLTLIYQFPSLRRWFGDHLCAKLAKRVRFLRLACDSGWQERLIAFASNSHGRRVWSFVRMSLNVKVKGQGHQGQNALCTHNSPAEWTIWSALVADNARKQQALRFDRWQGVSSLGC